MAAIAALLVITWVVHAQTPPPPPTNQDATGQPKIVASAEGAPYLFAETSDIRDGNGLPLTEDSDTGGIIEFVYSYQWIRVDSGDSTETNVGADSPRHQLWVILLCRAYLR